MINIGQKFTTEKKKLIFFDQKLQLWYSSLGLHKASPCYRRSLQPKREDLKT
jgi:hypothetical protein